MLIAAGCSNTLSRKRSEESTPTLKLESREVEPPLDVYIADGRLFVRYKDSVEEKDVTILKTISRFDVGVSRGFEGISGQGKEGLWVASGDRTLNLLLSGRINRKVDLNPPVAKDSATSFILYLEDQCITCWRSNYITGNSLKDGKVLWSIESKAPAHDLYLDGDLNQLEFLEGTDSLCYVDLGKSQIWSRVNLQPTAAHVTKAQVVAPHLFVGETGKLYFREPQKADEPRYVYGPDSVQSWHASRIAKSENGRYAAVAMTEVRQVVIVDLDSNKLFAVKQCKGYPVCVALTNDHVYAVCLETLSQLPAYFGDKNTVEGSGVIEHFAL